MINDLCQHDLGNIVEVHFCLSSTLYCIVMQMRKANSEKRFLMRLMNQSGILLCLSAVSRVDWLILTMPLHN